MATLGVTLCEITLPTCLVDDILKVSITFFSNTFTTMDSVSAEKSKIEEYCIRS